MFDDDDWQSHGGGWERPSSCGLAAKGENSKLNTPPVGEAHAWSQPQEAVAFMPQYKLLDIALPAPIGRENPVS
ncbi:hypothetical protein EVAR_32523_1 [Eumeta japonica]|uniref:Uncharacterized protein n=1 Tax=Eumeta variegata TaxID=151549 RepID=A0A4C1WA46_EUMVA|nr:hypothetical protein EVAR_32523_1 [Eumeta japonica]